MTNHSRIGNFICNEQEQRYKCEIYLPFWRSSLPISIDGDNVTGLPKQHGIEILHTMIGYEGDFRGPFIRAAFDYYVGEIYGSFDAFDKDGNNITQAIAPKVTELHEIWPMLSKPEIYIYSWDLTYEVSFGISFDSLWDDEHGFGIQCQDWKIVNVGAAGDVW